MAQQFQFFTIVRKKSFIEIICLFEIPNESVMIEIKSVFNLVFFGSIENVKLNTIKVIYFDHLFANEILNFAKNLSEKKRKFFIYEITTSFRRYLIRFGLNQVVLLSSE